MESRSVRRKLFRGTRTPSSDLWTWGTFVILFFMSQCRLSQECPSVCECKWKSGKESVVCSKNRLKVIPNGLDPGTQLLDMSNNMMEKLPNKIFLSLNLLNLQKIFLSECQLVSLEDDSFAKLINLIELDLSGNRLETIPSRTFNSIPELRELKVSSNPISRLSNDAFVALPRLVRLELTACRLGTIETWAFRGLPDLEWLRLDNNRLLTVQAESFYPLRSLHGLEVSGNPWNCSCLLQPLREWMGKNNVPFGVPPTCLTPKRVEGKSWDRLQLEDFACLPKLTSSTDQERISRVVEGENGTLLCRFRATPDTQVRWLSGNKGSMVTNGSSGTASAFVLTESFVWTSSDEYQQQHGSSEEGRSGDRSLGIKISKLTVIRTTPREAGFYVCRAESKAGFVLANFTLLVLQTRAEGLTGRLLFTGALVVALLTLVICLLLLCVILGSRRVRTASRILTEAEKIELNHMDHEHMRQNGGGTVPLIGANNGSNGGANRIIPVMNHIQVHHNNNSSSNSGGGGGGGSSVGVGVISGSGGGGGGNVLTHSLNNVMMLRSKSGGSSNSGCDGGSREYNDYKALPTNDPDDNDIIIDKNNSNCSIALISEEDESQPFLHSNLNNIKQRHHSSSTTPLQSPCNHQILRGQDHHQHHHHYNNSSSTLSSPNNEKHFISERNFYQHTKDTFPDLLNEKISNSSTNSEFTTSLPRPYRNHDPRPGSYFHRRINSESQSPLLSNSYGVSMERVGMGGGGICGGSDTNFIGGGGGGGGGGSSGTDSLLSMSSGAMLVGGSGQLLNRTAQQRLSMPTSPIHERDVLSYDYHAAQLAAFLEEYHLLQLELMRMSASLNHVDQPNVLTNNVNSSTSTSTSSRQQQQQQQQLQHLGDNNKPPHVPLRTTLQQQQSNNFQQEQPTTRSHLQQRHLLNRSGSGSDSNTSQMQALQHSHSQHHHHQLKSILKNPTANNNNYMA